MRKYAREKAVMTAAAAFLFTDNSQLSTKLAPLRHKEQWGFSLSQLKGLLSKRIGRKLPQKWETFSIAVAF